MNVDQGSRTALGCHDHRDDRVVGGGRDGFEAAAKAISAVICGESDQAGRCQHRGGHGHAAGTPLTLPESRSASDEAEGP